MNLVELQNLTVVKEKAEALILHLRKNVGVSADYPLTIVADNLQDAENLEQLFTELEKALSAYNNKSYNILR